MYQTDFNGFIKDDGCLFFSLIRLAEMKAAAELNRLQIANLIYVLHDKMTCSYDEDKPVLSDEILESMPGVFVWDHERVVNEALLSLDIAHTRIKYTGRIYMPWEEVKGKNSFGGWTNADEIVLHIKTTNGGHFRLPNYDPWEPGTHMIDLKSIRYYRWI